MKFAVRLVYLSSVALMFTMLVFGNAFGQMVGDSPASDKPKAIPNSFIGKWVGFDNKDHYVLVTVDTIRWERGDMEGPEIIPITKCSVSTDSHSVSFPVRSSVGALVDGKMVRGTVVVTMTETNDTLTISQGASDTIKDSRSGFAFQQIGGTKHLFRKVQDK